MVAGCAVAPEAVTPSGRIVRATRNPCEERPDVIDLLLRIGEVSRLITEITVALSPKLGEARE